MRLLACTIALSVTTLLSGCTNPFTPATPEPPGAGGGVVEQFNSTENLLATVAAAMSVRGVSGQTAYYNALADSTGPGVFAFYAFHAPGDIDAWHAQTGLTPDPVWAQGQERPFFGYLGELAPGLTYAFTWTPDDLSGLDPTPTETLAMVHRHYYLTASSSDFTSERIVAVGYADLYMQKVGARWFLYRWEDRIDPAYGANPSDPDAISMGRLRLNSYSHP
jgi:hypothetical protein